MAMCCTTMSDNPQITAAAGKVINHSLVDDAEAIELERRIFIGGVVWRRDSDGTTAFAVVQNNEAAWSLPRSALDVEHPDPKAALCKAMGLPQAVLKMEKVIHVGHDGPNLQAPIIAYWQASLTVEGLAIKCGANLKWTSARKAVRRLTDHHDSSAIAAYMTTSLETLELDQKFSNLSRFRRGLLSSPNRARLIGELRRSGARLSTYQFKWFGEAPYKAALFMFSKALSAFYQQDYEGSWKCLADVSRLEFFLMDKGELGAQRVIIEEQGKAKLNGWRADAFRRVMKKFDDTETPELLGQALGLISDSQETKFFSISLMQRQANLVSLLLIVLSAAFLLVAVRFSNLQKPLSDGIPSASGGYWTPLIGSFLLGAIGACVSALISFSQRQVMRIPDRLMDFIITLVRPVIGGASALISTFLLLSGVIHIAQPTLAFLFVVAFAFGFSERLVINTIDRLSTR